MAVLSLSQEQRIPDSLHSRALSFRESAWTNLQVPFLKQTPPGRAWPRQNKSWPVAVCHETANTSESGGQRSTTPISNTFRTTREPADGREQLHPAPPPPPITFLLQVSAQNDFPSEGMASQMHFQIQTEVTTFFLLEQIANFKIDFKKWGRAHESPSLGSFTQRFWVPSPTLK